NLVLLKTTDTLKRDNLMKIKTTMKNSIILLVFTIIFFALTSPSQGQCQNAGTCCTPGGGCCISCPRNSKCCGGICCDQGNYFTKGCCPTGDCPPLVSADGPFCFPSF